jgi:hypothetical protein
VRGLSGTGAPASNRSGGRPRHDPQVEDRAVAKIPEPCRGNITGAVAARGEHAPGHQDTPGACAMEGLWSRLKVLPDPIHVGQIRSERASPLVAVAFRQDPRDGVVDNEIIAAESFQTHEVTRGEGIKRPPHNGYVVNRLTPSVGMETPTCSRPGTGTRAATGRRGAGGKLRRGDIRGNVPAPVAREGMNNLSAFLDGRRRDGATVQAVGEPGLSCGVGRASVFGLPALLQCVRVGPRSRAAERERERCRGQPPGRAQKQKHR